MVTLEHYIKISSVKELPLETSNSLWSTFFPVLKKGTNKMQGSIDLCRSNEHIEYEHFKKMEGLHMIRNNYIMKVDLSDFYMHFLISKNNRRYMQFMWEGRKYQCISMPFSLAPAPQLATQMMALAIHYLQSCGLQLAICIMTSSYCPDPTRSRSSRHNCRWMPHTIPASAFILTNVL